ncbi:hypothetical protein RNA01_45340 [Ciceribacter naphthalenivorans]|uniref:Uncharacterized protein n=2 Tax=Alphaproteobacteria TaxID=28211 RepID=A0A512HQ78_9HYPH|nr:hypothetical protein RNA01_45340 [Ciceribacter naphthalenivorans]
MGSLRKFRSGKFHAYGQHTVKLDNLRQAQANIDALRYVPISQRRNSPLRQSLL